MKASKINPDLTLRPAEAQDCAALTALWYLGWKTGHEGIVPDALVKYRDEASFAARIKASLPTCYAAEVDGRLVGFIRLKDSELDQFYVASDLIGQGVAGVLMSAAEALLCSQGVTRAFLIAAAGNHRAIRFYEKRGWANMGEMTADVETADGPFGMGVVRFEKTLA